MFVELSSVRTSQVDARIKRADESPATTGYDGERDGDGSKYDGTDDGDPGPDDDAG